MTENQIRVRRFALKTQRKWKHLLGVEICLNAEPSRHINNHKMKYLNYHELSKLVYEDYTGKNFIGYKFKIDNSPTIRFSKEYKNLKSCSCAFHSIKDIDFKKDCRYTKALKIKLDEKTIL